MFKKLSETLKDKYSRKDELSKNLQIVKVFDIYKKELKEVFGEGDDAKPISLRNKTLTVQATSSVVANELRLREHEIIKKINSGAGTEAIKRIIYRF